jgi:hypothetical protein
MLKPKAGDRVEFRAVDASLARALFHGIPAARLLARARLATDQRDHAAGWDGRMRKLLRAETPAYERVRRAVARHGRVALDEGPLQASDATVAVLIWAVARDPEADASLAELAPAGGERHPLEDDDAVRACAGYDERLASEAADKRAPAFEACVQLATRASIGPIPWEKLRVIAAQLERAEIGVRLFGDTPASIFPRRVDDEIAPSDRRMAAIDRGVLDALVAKDPRQLGSAIWRTEQAAGGASVHLATFLADMARLLAHEGTLVASLSRPEPPDADDVLDISGATPSWMPTQWTSSTAAALADALERGMTTFARVRAAASRGGEDALDAIGAEMLHVGAHGFASAAFAEILARTARPRDVIRLVTYFAIAPDPAPAAHALGACTASELPRVLSAWLEAMLPQEGDDALESSSVRVSACVASLKPYPQLYHALRPLLSRLSEAPTG